MRRTTDHWEYRDLTIPLGLEEGGRDFQSRYYLMVVNRLQQAARDGWEPDGPIDFRSALNAGRIKEQRKRVGWTHWGHTTYESVTIRLKRIAQDQ